MTARAPAATTGARRAPLHMIAAVLAAALAFAAPARAQVERVPAGPEDMLRPGAAFGYYMRAIDPARVEGLNTSLNILTAAGPDAAAAIAAVRAGIENGTAASSPDMLARSITISMEETFSIIAQGRFLDAISKTDPVFGEQIREARMDVFLPDGTPIDVPVPMAAAIHALNVSAAGAKLRGEKTPDVSGVYEVATEGPCALGAGEIAITQEGFIVEGGSPERLALFGAVGTASVYVVATERRFARIEKSDGGRPKIRVPDEPLDLLRAALPGADGALMFRSVTRGKCALALTRPG